jgi:phenylalanyl-tRNA synthetase beta chain
VVFELEWQAIDTRFIPEAAGLSKFPANRRDIAVIADESLASGDVVAACLQSGNALIKDAQLFDLYTGKGVEDGKKSLAIALILQSDERTLEEADISDAVSGVVNNLSEKLGVVLRD